MYEKPGDYNKKIIPRLNKTLFYIYFLDKEHPLAYQPDGLVYYHRHVASIKIGRWLTQEEIVHHIDENRANNSFDNLQIMSRSEHAKLHHPIKWNNSDRNCPTCNCLFLPICDEQIYCSNNCVSKSQIKFEVTKEELSQLIWQMPTTKVGELFDVSDKAIEKRCKKLGIEKPPRGYWAREKMSNKCDRCQKTISSNVKHCKNCWPLVQHLYRSPPRRKGRNSMGQ